MAYPFCLNCSIFRPRGARRCPNCGADFATQDAQLAAQEASGRPQLKQPTRPSGTLVRIFAALLALVLISVGVAGFLASRQNNGSGPYPMPPASPPPAPAPTPTGPVSLAYHFIPRSTVVYRARSRIDGTITYQGGSPHAVHRQVDTTVRMTVIAVDLRGVTTVQVRVEGVGSDSLGRLDDAHRPKLGPMRVAADGRVLRGSGLGVLASGSPDVWVPGLDQTFPVLPSHPAVPGDHWNIQSNQRFGYGFGSLSCAGNASFDAYANVSGAAAPEISGQMRVPLTLTLDVPKALLLDGHPEEKEKFKDASVTYNGAEVALHQSAWLNPLGSWPSNIDLRGSFGGTITLQGFPGSLASATAALDLTFEQSLTAI